VFIDVEQSAHCPDLIDMLGMLGFGKEWSKRSKIVFASKITGPLIRAFPYICL
jgi:hypothetical protein